MPHPLNKKSYKVVSFKIIISKIDYKSATLQVQDSLTKEISKKTIKENNHNIL